MFGGAIPPRTGAERAEQIDLGEKLKVVAGAHGAGLHEILAGVAGKAGAHKDVQHVMHERLCLGIGDALMIRQGPDQVGVAAMVVLPARQQLVGIGVAARADHIMHRAAEGIHAVPVERIMGQRRHRAQRGKTAPHALSSGDMRAMQRAGFAGVEPFGQIVLRPKVQITDLWPLDRGNPKEMPRRHGKAACVTRGDGDLVHFGQRFARASVKRHVRHGQRFDGIADHGRNSAAGVGIMGRCHSGNS